LNDLGPGASFIAANYTLPFNVTAFALAAQRILSDAETELGWMYQTLHTDGKTQGRINFTVWSEVFSCPECTGEVNFLEEALDRTTKRVRDQFRCPHCSAELTKDLLERDFETLVDLATKCIRSASSEQRICVHWAMTAATHRFFFDVASSVGRLLKLHGSANRSQIKRRMTEAWGDRSTLERTIQHVLRSLGQWELLRTGPEHGSLIGPAKRIRLDEEFSQLLLHAVLLAQGRAGSFSQLTDHPALFPFTLNLSRKSLSENPWFQVHRQGDQSELIELRHPRNGPVKWMDVA
jgi:cytochrome c-type biogenesis protein CcmH/NrfF